MTVIVLNDEQVQTLNEAAGDVELQDRTGHSLGVVSHSFTDAEIEEAKQRSRSEGPWLTTKELLARIRAHLRRAALPLSISNISAINVDYILTCFYE